MAKLAKVEVKYGRGHLDSHCGPSHRGDTGYCAHFYRNAKLAFASPGKCYIVEGSISPGAWCEKFSRVIKPK